jgi:hypothetical protein
MNEMVISNVQICKDGHSLTASDWQIVTQVILHLPADVG